MKSIPGQFKLKNLQLEHRVSQGSDLAIREAAAQKPPPVQPQTRPLTRIGQRSGPRSIPSRVPSSPWLELGHWRQLRDGPWCRCSVETSTPRIITHNKQLELFYYNNKTLL